MLIAKHAITDRSVTNLRKLNYRHDNSIEKSVIPVERLYSEKCGHIKGYIFIYILKTGHTTIL